jgi:oxygen-independent coproporphyrinogen-3 oxidase
MTRRTLIPIAAATTASTASATGDGLSSLPPLSLYIHYPWCVRKCPYCDFNSHEARSGIPEEAYLAALIQDLESALPQIWGRRIVSVFIGGGTPSLLSAQAVDELLGALRARLPLLADAEITLEANPGTVEADKFAAFRAAGINRLSLGIQSFDDRHLAALGRIHGGDEARRAIELALRHFDNVNLDLMYALPQQTLVEAQRDIETAAGYGTTHLSAYHLTLEPNTAFHHAPPPLPDDDLAADMQEMLESTLAAQGYEHYETSAYARPGRRCQHNLNYWTYGDYLGIGAGAHGKISSADGIVRETRRRHPRDYLDAAARGEFALERRVVARAELPFEFMMNALRLADGFAPALFEAHTGLPLATQGAALLEAQRRGLLDVGSERIAPTPHGRRFLNELLEIFLEQP